MKVLVTGAAGFIGSRLSEALEAHGHDVVGIDNLSTGRHANNPKVVVGDVNDWRLLGGDWDLIYHCAASYHDRHAWERDVRTNVLGTVAVLKEAQRTGARLIYFQTALCYGHHTWANPIPTFAQLDPVGSYAISKTAAEQYIRDSGVDYVSLRLANIYGPRNLSGPIPTFYRNLSQGKPCTVVDTRRDFVYIDDLVWLAVKAAEQGSGVYHVSSGRDYSILDVFETVCYALGIAPETEVVAPGSDDVPSLLLDPSATQAEYGWTAQTPLVEGIRKAVEWYQANPVGRTYTHLKAAVS